MKTLAAAIACSAGFALGAWLGGAETEQIIYATFVSASSVIIVRSMI